MIDGMTGTALADHLDVSYRTVVYWTQCGLLRMSRRGCGGMDPRYDSEQIGRAERASAARLVGVSGRALRDVVLLPVDPDQDVVVIAPDPAQEASVFAAARVWAVTLAEVPAILATEPAAVFVPAWPLKRP